MRIQTEAFGQSREPCLVNIIRRNDGTLRHTQYFYQEKTITEMQI